LNIAIIAHFSMIVECRPPERGGQRYQSKSIVSEEYI